MNRMTTCSRVSEGMREAPWENRDERNCNDDIQDTFRSNTNRGTDENMTQHREPNVRESNERLRTKEENLDFGSIRVLNHEHTECPGVYDAVGRATH